MNIGTALQYVFEDDQWVKKLLIGAAVTLIPIFGGLALLGYVVATLRNIRAGASRPLPEWMDLGALFIDGLKLAVVILIYLIPMWVLLVPVVAVWVAPFLGGEDEQLVTVLASVAGIISVALTCVMALYGLFISVITPALYIRYAETGEIGPCLRIGEVLRYAFERIGQLLVAQLLRWAAGIVTGAVISAVGGTLGLIPVCGWLLAFVISLLGLPVSVWVGLFSAHMYAQIAGLQPIEPA